MVLYRANIKPLAAFASALQSDTFFGAFCWSYRYLFGEEKLEEMLRESAEKGPCVIFSNAFPAGCLPLPVGIYDTGRKGYGEVDKAEAKKAYQQNKQYKKCTMIERSTFCSIQNGAWSGYSSSLRQENTKQIGVTHNKVGRETGTVGAGEQGGELFVLDEYFLGRDESLDLFILTSLEKEILTRVLNLMFELGIGGKKTVGKGCFQVLSLEEETELLSVEGANGYVALSNFIPAADDPTEGGYRTLVKYGRLDREYAAGDYPFKKPLLFIQAGAMFRTGDIRAYYGSVVKNIAVQPDVVVNACTIALPVRIPEECLGKFETAWTDDVLTAPEEIREDVSWRAVEVVSMPGIWQERGSERSEVGAVLQPYYYL